MIPRLHIRNIREFLKIPTSKAQPPDEVNQNFWAWDSPQQFQSSPGDFSVHQVWEPRLRAMLYSAGISEIEILCPDSQLPGTRPAVTHTQQRPSPNCEFLHRGSYQAPWKRNLQDWRTINPSLQTTCLHRCSPVLLRIPQPSLLFSAGTFSELLLCLHTSGVTLSPLSLRRWLTENRSCCPSSDLLLCLSLFRFFFLLGELGSDFLLHPSTSVLSPIHLCLWRDLTLLTVLLSLRVNGSKGCSVLRKDSVVRKDGHKDFCASCPLLYPL